MKHGILTPAIATVLLAVLPVFAADGTGAPRNEIELSWDDGSAEGGFTAQVGRKFAVGFQAPETALSLRAIRLYIMDDGVENPVNPGDPTTRECTIWVWRDVNGAPGAPANPGEYLAAGYPEAAWVDFVLTEPVDLSDETHFPDRRFHVGLEWEVRTNPVIGLDLDPPFSGETRGWDWAAWSVVDTADALIRAVVCDSTAVPVELRSWGRVKSEYR
jgi:hypothetical protein